jgi:rod shape determining protein RodA
LQSAALIIYAAGVGGLFIVFFTGQVVRGTVSRLELFGFQLQPSELMKIALLISLAALLAKKRGATWSALWRSFGLVIIPAGLVLAEPDLGVAVLLLTLWLGLLVFAGLPGRAAAALSVLGAAGAAVAWQFLLPYQQDRLRIFLDPASDPLGAGYNIVQSIVALGSGRLLGRGLGHGPQSQLSFLPERHTDFILASIGEELGFIGICLVLVLYGVMLWRVLLIARNTRDPFGSYLAAGVYILTLVSLVVGAGMNMGLLPVTGLPVPLLSYGGSNLLTTFILLGIVQSVHMHSKWVQAPPSEISQF